VCHTRRRFSPRAETEPRATSGAAGITAFEIDGWKSKDAMKKLRERRIVATVAPYSTACLRFTPGIINTPDEVDAGLAAIRRLG
jgi:selenocysteine lyase/cysteine desulfurase